MVVKQDKKLLSWLFTILSAVRDWRAVHLQSKIFGKLANKLEKKKRQTNMTILFFMK